MTTFFSEAGRMGALKIKFISYITTLVESAVAKWLLISLFVVIALSNVLGGVPGRYAPTMFYSNVILTSLAFWFPIFMCSLITDFKGFFAHMFPIGAPIWIIVLLPIVEFVSIILRPLILVIRLATNLAAGHILLYIFSYFATLLPEASPLIGGLLGALYVIEFFISILQAYIFVTLITLYIQDSL
jgi:ATP synthase subunit 6